MELRTIRNRITSLVVNWLAPENVRDYENQQAFRIEEEAERIRRHRLSEGLALELGEKSLQDVHPVESDPSFVSTQQSTES